MHQHARAIAKETMEKNRLKALQFDNQSALQRKMNEAQRLAKSQAHIRDETPETLEGVDTSTKTLVDCKFCVAQKVTILIPIVFSGLGRAQFPEPDDAHWTTDNCAAPYAPGRAEGLSTEGSQLAGDALGTGHQR